MKITRRETLLATGTAFGFAGCLGDAGSDDPANAGNASDGDGNGNGTPVGVTAEVFDLPPTLARPLWAAEEDATGFISLVTSADDPLWMVDDPGAVDGLEAWLSETDWNRSVLVSVQSVGPNTCYGTLDVRDVAVEGDTIVGAAAAVDGSDEGGACGEAITHPGALVRVTGDDLPTDATFTVTDGWGSSMDVSADGQLVAPAALPGHVRPGGDPPRVTDLACDDPDFRRLGRPDGEVALGEAHDADGDVTFAMRAHDGGSNGGKLQFGRGDEVRVTMHNVSTESLVTGNRHKYNLQVSTMDGWQDVRGVTDGDPVAYTDEGIGHRPGDGFEWAFELSEDGVVADHPQAERLTVCPELHPGRYRFVFWEAAGEQLAVEFHYSG